MKVKRILAAVVAFAMLLTMSVASFAAAPADLPEYEYEVLGSMDIVATDGWKGPEKAMTLDGAMVFKAVDTYDEALASTYADWNADFVIEFDQDVTATLAGNYGTYGWIALPEYDFEAGVAYGIMKESGLDKEVSKYSDVVLLVEEFTCGLDFAADTPADAKVTLGLYLTNPEDETETYLIGKEFVYTVNGLLPEYKAEEIEVDGLDFAMVFEAVDSYDEALASDFANWVADYEITFSNDATAVLSGQYDAHSPEWIDLPAYDFEADVPVRVLEEAQLGTFTYADIVLAVEKFQCGVKDIEAPYGTEITLSLTLTNADGEKVVVCEKAFTYAVLETAEDVNALTKEQIEENVDAIKDAIATLEPEIKQEISKEVIKNIVDADIDKDATEPAAYSADPTVTVKVEAENENIPEALQGADTYDITAYENGVETHEIDMPVLIAVPIEAGKTIAKVVHVRTDGTEEVITDYWTENNILYYWMSDFSYVGVFYAGEAVLKLEATADADTFNVVLEGDVVETVKNFVSGEFKVAVTGDVEYTIAGIKDKTTVSTFADGKVLVNVPNFADGSSWSSVITDEAITLATIKITSNGAGTITLSDAAMHKHNGTGSNLWAPIVTNIGNATDFDTEADDAGVAKKELEVKVVFNNPVEYAAAAYNEMIVTINGTAYALGSDAVDVDMSTTECAYIIKAEVEELAAFDIKVEGAGYRTAYYSNTMRSENRTVSFWNNAENVAQVRDVDATGVEYAKSFTNFLAGDVYEDGIINTTDLAAVVGQFGKTATAEHDLNRDSKIDSKDVAYVLVSWGK